ncbi:helix-turn-helix domain-containing protein [Enterococcus sp. UD-01]|jgi:Rgg/GadR/MutR family transcriptional activator|uniref:Rgg/GadR/MutR family transcriptional regulator n=1 Tax=Enterococcus sp. UD-01 TaxID=3373911 RepID=UPI003833E213
MLAGELVNKIRKERKLTQEKLSSGICTRQTLASYENLTVDIPFTKLLKIIDKLNVTIEEFTLQLKQTNDQKRFISEHMIKDFYSNQYIKQKDLTWLLRLYDETSDFFYLASYLQIKSSLIKVQNLDDQEFLKDEKNNINKLMNHLDIVERWGNFELAIFTNCLWIFPMPYIFVNSEKVISHLIDFSEIRIYERSAFSFFFNIIILFIDKNDLKIAKYFFEKMENTLHIDTHQLYEKSFSVFLKNCITLMESNFDDNESYKSSYNIINYFYFLGFHKKAKELSNLLESLRG